MDSLCTLPIWKMKEGKCDAPHCIQNKRNFWLALSTGFAPTRHSSVTIIPLTNSDWKFCFTLTLRRWDLLRDQLKMPYASVRVLQFNWFIHKLQWCLVWTSFQKEIQKQVAVQLKPIILVSFNITKLNLPVISLTRRYFIYLSIYCYIYLFIVIFIYLL